MLTIMVQFVYYFSHISHLSINSFTGVYRQASWFHLKFVCNNLLVTKAEKGRFCRLVTEYTFFPSDRWLPRGHRLVSRFL